MARPLRIEYKNAVYHVMNRGKSHQAIFHGSKYTDHFMQCVEQACYKFNLEILAYCLMGNHYHLLVRTPQANLSRCMRHINGVYTQIYNKTFGTDGPLFRGRYKAIVVDAENYLLQVSRYIHRNPIETDPPLVNRLTDYRLSSYTHYLNPSNSPPWLHCETILSLFEKKEAKFTYQYFVENTMPSDDLNPFYHEEPIPTILGSKNFAKQIKQWAHKESQEVPERQRYYSITLEKILEVVSHHFKISTEEVLTGISKHKQASLARKLTMYFAHRTTKLTLAELAATFNVKHYSAISHASSRIFSAAKRNDNINQLVSLLSQDLTP
ncbi:MAG: transposase [Coxiellaceae bacterium]|nr:transposase [Coxiellaceae bacterium]